MVHKLGLICIYQGDDWAGLLTVNNCDGTPADLANYNVNAQIREGTADQQWRIAACFLPAIILPNQISLSLTHRQTECLRNINYRWDCQIVSPDGVITTVVAGRVNVTHEITRERRRWRPNEIQAFEAIWFYGETFVEPAELEPDLGLFALYEQ